MTSTCQAETFPFGHTLPTSCRNVNHGFGLGVLVSEITWKLWLQNSCMCFDLSTRVFSNIDMFVTVLAAKSIYVIVKLGTCCSFSFRARSSPSSRRLSPKASSKVVSCGSLQSPSDRAPSSWRTFLDFKSRDKELNAKRSATVLGLSTSNASGTHWMLVGGNDGKCLEPSPEGGFGWLFSTSNWFRVWYFGHLQNLPTIVQLKGHRAISPKVKKNHPFSCSRFASLESHVAGDLKPKAVVPGCYSQALSQ